MSRKMWLFVGGGFGFAVPFLLGALQHFGAGHVRPSAYFLFRPGLFVLAPFGELLQTLANSNVLVFLVGVANAAVFGAAAYGLRKYFLMVIAALLAIVYFSLPPSDAKLERQ